MLVSICTVDYDINGDILLNADASSDFSYLGRRITRTPTLNGGAFFVDNGYSAADGTITLNLTASNNSADLYRYLCAMLKNYGQYRLSSREGCFLVYFQNMTAPQTDTTLTFLIAAQLA